MSLLPHWGRAVAASLSQRPISSGSAVRTVNRRQKHQKLRDITAWMGFLCVHGRDTMREHKIWDVISDLVEHFLSFSFELWLHLKVFLCKRQTVAQISGNFSFIVISIKTFRSGIAELLTRHVHYTGDKFFFIIGDLLELWQTHKELQ